MIRIDTAGRAPDLFGPGKDGFRDGDPLTGIPATQLTAEWFNAIQEEIAAVIEDAGLILDPNNLRQLLAALNARSPFRGVEVYVEANITHVWVPPPGTKYVWVEVTGGGAGGSAAPADRNGGGGGGVAFKMCDLTGVTSVDVVVGGGGPGGPDGTTGGNGGTSSFGAFCSATGGKASSGGYGRGGQSGHGVGGDFNSGLGDGGSYMVQDVGGNGGGPGGFGTTPANPGASPGQGRGGGGGGGGNGVAGGDGAAGSVIIFY